MKSKNLPLGQDLLVLGQHRQLSNHCLEYIVYNYTVGHERQSQEIKQKTYNDHILIICRMFMPLLQ